ncbi:MAG: sulfatase-like hydrolase/transferase, partial [Myxococcota bacterium]|nr:sulfatase-like hydrolase/transferase [Myxococcota bacterium]
MSLWLGLLVGCVGVLSDGPGEAKDGVAKERPPDIFLFTVDTLRADHLPIYGYARDTAPWLTSLAEQGLVFDNAYGTSSWTVPSVASMLTGMLPHQLGVRTPPVKNAAIRPRLPDAAETVAEWLKGSGYATYAITSNAHLDTSQGFGQGFDFYQNVVFAPAQAVAKGVGEIREQVEDSRAPVFVWIHLFDPHDPYFRHEPWFDSWDPTYDEYVSDLGRGPDIES